MERKKNMGIPEIQDTGNFSAEPFDREWQPTVTEYVEITHLGLPVTIAIVTEPPKKPDDEFLQ